MYNVILIAVWYHYATGFPGGLSGKRIGLLMKELKETGRQEFDPWVGKIPWKRKWQPTPLLLPGESHGQRRLSNYNPWGHKDLDTTVTKHAQTHTPNLDQVVLYIESTQLFIPLRHST